MMTLARPGAAQTSLPSDEIARHLALLRFEVLETPPEATFDRITALASQMLSMPICLISLVDATRLWFKSHHGIDISEAPRYKSLCAHAILGDDVFVVEDAKSDSRFKGHLLVAGSIGARFYAGAPLTTSDGYKLGTICVLGTVPHQFGPDQLAILKGLADTVVDAMELRLAEKRALAEVADIRLAEEAAEEARLAAEVAAERAVAEADAAEEARSRFVAAVSHDFQVPLKTIASVTAQALASELSDAQRVLIKAALQSAERLLGMMPDIGDIGDADADQPDQKTVKSDEHVRLDARVDWLAYHDPETSLANRSGFIEQLATLLAAATKDDQPLAVIALELQHTGGITAVFGADSLVMLAMAMGARLTRALRGHDLIARIDTRGFAAALPGVSIEQAQQLAETLRATLLDPISLGEFKVHAPARTGMAIFPSHAGTAEDLLRRAELAMRIAGEKRVDWQVYDPQFETDAKEKLTLAADLRTSIAESQLRLFYQPKVRLSDNHVGEVEALMRWQQPSRGNIPPIRFIPIAEETGLILPLTDFALDEAMRQTYGWGMSGLDHRISVNMSPRSFLDRALPENLRLALAKWAIPSHRIILELTESTLMIDAELARAVIDELKLQEIDVAVDDFGTGYSSLSYLERFSVSEIKLDYSFIKTALTNSASRKIIHGVVALGHALDRRIVAEGVESEELLHLVEDAGCDFAQGYYYTEALPAAQYAEWLANFKLHGAVPALQPVGA